MRHYDTHCLPEPSLSVRDRLEEEAEEEDSKAGAAMTLSWFGLLEAALLTILLGYVVGFVIAAQKGTFSMDQLLRLLPWLVILAVGVVLVAWVILKVMKNLIAMFRKAKKETD